LRHNQFSSSFSSSRSNCNVISFRSDMGTDGRTNGPTDRPTDGPTNAVSFRGATSRLKICIHGDSMAFFVHFMNALVTGIVLMKPIKTPHMHMRELKALSTTSTIPTSPTTPTIPTTPTTPTTRTTPTVSITPGRRCRVQPWT
jgi:hypothetical protein